VAGGGLDELAVNQQADTGGFNSHGGSGGSGKVIGIIHSANLDFPPVRA
jgi:hypothetical protein